MNSVKELVDGQMGVQLAKHAATELAAAQEAWQVICACAAASATGVQRKTYQGSAVCVASACVDLQEMQLQTTPGLLYDPACDPAVQLMDGFGLFSYAIDFRFQGILRQNRDRLMTQLRCAMVDAAQAAWQADGNLHTPDCARLHGWLQRAGADAAVPGAGGRARGARGGQGPAGPGAGKA